jgi:hypothetical protein
MQTAPNDRLSVEDQGDLPLQEAFKLADSVLSCVGRARHCDIILVRKSSRSFAL